IMNRSRVLSRCAAAFLLAGAAAWAQAQEMRLDVSGVGASQYPIAIGNFAGDSQLPEDIAAVIRNDLAASGLFRIVPTNAVISDSATPDFATLRSQGADSVVGGSYSRLADGRYDVRYRLSDTVRQRGLGGESIVAGANDLRYAGHRAADFIFEKLTGQKGIFSTRIAFITKQGGRYRLKIADWDGRNEQTSLTSPEPIISPSWAPDGGRLAYVSFESRKPVVYVHTLSTGQRKAVANFKGSNSAPAWSPDGKTLAVALTRDGLSQIYLIPSDGGGEPRRLVSSSGIDTEPYFSPDGKFIYFTSDRGGSPQIYRVEVGGGSVSRVTFEGSYNVSPRVSPDGRKLAYVTRREGGFFVMIKDLASGAETRLSDGGREESPSFAPNGLWVMYATRANGRDMLMAASVDGRVKQRMSSETGDRRHPTWGPFGP